MSDDRVRRLAMALPEVTEQDHHGMVSFRVAGKIFATVPDPEHVRIMVDEPEILSAVAEHPGVCEPLRWGRRLAGVEVNSDQAGPELLRELLVQAWRRKAPGRLADR